MTKSAVGATTDGMQTSDQRVEKQEATGPVRDTCNRYRWTTTITTANLLIWSFFCFHRQTVNWFHAYLTICFTIIDCTRVSRGLQMLLPLGNGHVIGHDYLHLAEQRFSHPGFFQQENAAQANRKLSWSVHVNHFPWKSRLIQNYNRHAFLGQKHGHYHISESDICWT